VSDVRSITADSAIWGPQAYLGPKIMASTFSLTISHQILCRRVLHSGN